MLTTCIIKTIHQKSSLLRTSLLCVALLFTVCPAYGVEVIVNAKVTERQIGINDLRSIFSLRQRYWTNGEKIRVFVLPDDNIVHKIFVKEKLQMFPHQLRRTWNRMTYTGTGQPPIVVDSVAEMIEKIKNTKYSIGYIDGRIEDENIHIFSAQ